MKLAGIPATPTLAPILLSQSVSSLTVQLTKITSTYDPIISYNLQIDNGLGDDFVNVGGFDTNSLLQTYVINQNIWRGLDYWLWYWAWNSIGWSGFSDILIAKAA